MIKETSDYIANKIYENGHLKRILVDGGYIEDGIYYFYETDHLGSNRTTISQSGTATEHNDYYPFGMQMGHNDPAKGASQLSASVQTSFKYNHKELDRMHGLNLYDYSARNQRSHIGKIHNNRRIGWEILCMESICLLPRQSYECCR